MENTEKEIELEEFINKTRAKLEGREKLMTAAYKVQLTISELDKWTENILNARNNIYNFSNILQKKLSDGMKVEIYARKRNEPKEENKLLYEYTMNGIDDLMDLVSERLYKELEHSLVCTEETVDEINELVKGKWN